MRYIGFRQVLKADGLLIPAVWRLSERIGPNAYHRVAENVRDRLDRLRHGNKRGHSAGGNSDHEVNRREDNFVGTSILVDLREFAPQSDIVGAQEAQIFSLCDVELPLRCIVGDESSWQILERYSGLVVAVG